MKKKKRGWVFCFALLKKTLKKYKNEVRPKGLSVAKELRAVGAN